ncbi:LysR family transcriptional regulator [Pseudorhodoplanes sp.]|uniref:LysR family transcriptional regulator n=1 Tax=Pseudorhodoplanes sp. TaxID=1934341 RepID=UPI002BA86F90|nr:LysR substrate-binding domain-containing protein [Pseudorhodoplanes sp.]HWV53524.1 LysR substrate-binding domain-containing protein [Pseudorhodoplanes sp.]
MTVHQDVSPRYDQLAAMRAFARVVEAGTFTRASESLGMPKATLTKLIQMLEAHLRTRLLNRTTRRVTVTADGAAYYERAVRLLSDLDELDGSMTTSQAMPKGRIRIDVSATLAMRIIIPALPEFHARYPDIQLDIGVTDRPVNLIAENVDCVVRGGEITDQSLIARRIAELQFITCAAPSYLERHGEPQSPSDLEKDHYLVGYFSPHTGQRWPMTFRLNGDTVQVTGRYIASFNDGTAYVAAGLAGLGVIQVPLFMVQEHILERRLQPILRKWAGEIMPLHVVYPPNRHLSAKLRILVDWLVEIFAKSTAMRPIALPD